LHDKCTLTCLWFIYFIYWSDYVGSIGYYEHSIQIIACKLTMTFKAWNQTFLGSPPMKKAWKEWEEKSVGGGWSLDQNASQHIGHIAGSAAMIQINAGYLLRLNTNNIIDLKWIERVIVCVISFLVN